MVGEQRGRRRGSGKPCCASRKAQEPVHNDKAVLAEHSHSSFSSLQPEPVPRSKALLLVPLLMVL